MSRFFLSGNLFFCPAKFFRLSDSCPATLPGVSPRLLLQFFFICASVISCVAFVVSSILSHLSFLWCLGKAVYLDCGLFWVSSLICTQKKKKINPRPTPDNPNLSIPIFVYYQSSSFAYLFPIWLHPYKPNRAH